MKDKTPLLLMEQLIMILVFALTAAVCLRGFAYAAEVSRDLQQKEQAVWLAQSTAETLKAERGISEHVLFYDEALNQVTSQANWSYRVEIQQKSCTVAGLGQADILVDSTDTHGIYALTVGWQEG